MRIENAAQAFEFLNTVKVRGFEMITKDLYQETWSDGEPITYSARELIKLARVWSSDNLQESTRKKGLKSKRNRKNRASQRNILATEEFDKIPQNDIIQGNKHQNEY